MKASLDLFPCEVLVDIFSFLDVGQLYEARQVCTRWQTIIEEYPDVWRGKRTITEGDLGVYSSLEGKLTRLIYLLQKLPCIDYYFFPVLVGSSFAGDKRTGPWHVYGITKETEECLKQLYVLLKELISEGRIPIHLDAINFIENTFSSRKWKDGIKFHDWKQDIWVSDILEHECSIAKCRSIIVPIWPPDEYHVRSYGPWLRDLMEDMGSNLEEIVIEKMMTHSHALTHGQWPSLQVTFRDVLYHPSRVRVLSVAGDEPRQLSSILPSVRLRPDRQLFSYDEFARLLDKLSKCNVIDGLMLFLDKLQREGRVQDCQIDRSEDRIMLADLLTALDANHVHQWPYPRLLRKMASSPINQLAVYVDVRHQRGQPASLPLAFLRADPFRHVTRLDVCLLLSEEDSSGDDGRLRAWKCLLQDDILPRMELLWVHFSDSPYGNRKGDARPLAAPVSAIALPRLESLQLHDPGSVAHVCSLLSGTSKLRCLHLEMYGLYDDASEQEHVAFWDTLLSAISQLTSLVSLTIVLEEPRGCGNWLQTCSWLTPTSTKQRGSSLFVVCVHLRDHVFVALSKLVQLESLSISVRAPPLKHYMFDAPSLQPDMQRLAAMLPRLRVVVLCGHVLKERRRSQEPGTQETAVGQGLAF